MNYAREYNDETPMRKLGRSIREYFEDVRREQGGSHGGYENRERRSEYSNRTMGFDGRRSRGVEPEEYGRYERREERGGDMHGKMRRYWQELREDMQEGDGEMSREFMQLMAVAAAEAVRCCMEENEKKGGRGRGSAEKRHKKLEKAVDKIRRAPLQDRNKMMREMFPDMQGAVQKVLQDLVAQESVENRARKIGLSKEQYCEAKEELTQMLQEQGDEEDEDE